MNPSQPLFPPGLFPISYDPYRCSQLGQLQAHPSSLPLNGLSSSEQQQQQQQYLNLIHAGSQSSTGQPHQIQLPERHDESSLVAAHQARQFHEREATTTGLSQFDLQPQPMSIQGPASTTCPDNRPAMNGYLYDPFTRLPISLPQGALYPTAFNRLPPLIASSSSNSTAGTTSLAASTPIMSPTSPSSYGLLRLTPPAIAAVDLHHGEGGQIHSFNQPVYFPSTVTSTTFEPSENLLRACCNVHHCSNPGFCRLSPCGCKLCRDHLGSVIRASKVISTDEQGRRTKLYRCSSCQVESFTIGGIMNHAANSEIFYSSSAESASSDGASASDDPASEHGLLSSRNTGIFSIQYTPTTYETGSTSLPPFAQESSNGGFESQLHDPQFQLHLPSQNFHPTHFLPSSTWSTGQIHPHSPPPLHLPHIPLPLPSLPIPLPLPLPPLIPNASYSQEETFESTTMAGYNQFSIPFNSLGLHTNSQFLPPPPPPPPPSYFLLQQHQSMTPSLPMMTSSTQQHSMRFNPNSQPFTFRPPLSNRVGPNPLKYRTGSKRGGSNGRSNAGAHSNHPFQALESPSYTVDERDSNWPAVSARGRNPTHLTTLIRPMPRGSFVGHHEPFSRRVEESKSNAAATVTTNVTGTGNETKLEAAAASSSKFVRVDPRSAWRVHKPAFPVIKIENLPFATTVKDIENWLPFGTIASKDDPNLILAVHLILHRETGRTLPHAYVEMKTIQIANEVMTQMDRKKLGDRTVRVKWERRGELMRDLFSQEGYFATPATSPAASALPPVPSHYVLPEVILTRKDLVELITLCEEEKETRECPSERAFLNFATIVSKRDAIFDCAFDIIGILCRRVQTDHLKFNWICQILKRAVLECTGFTAEQKEEIRQLVENSNASANEFTRKTVAPSTPALSPVKARRGGVVVVGTPPHSSTYRSEKRHHKNSHARDQFIESHHIERAEPMNKIGLRDPAAGSEEWPATGVTTSLDAAQAPHTPPPTPPHDATDFEKRQSSIAGWTKTLPLAQIRRVD